MAAAIPTACAGARFRCWRACSRWWTSTTPCGQRDPTSSHSLMSRQPPPCAKKLDRDPGTNSSPGNSSPCWKNKSKWRDVGASARWCGSASNDSARGRTLAPTRSPLRALGAGQFFRQGHNRDSGSPVVAQLQFRGALIAQPEKFDATGGPCHFTHRDTGKNCDVGVQAEQLSLMQIKKSGRAARVGAFGEHFCLLSGAKNLIR